MKHLTNIYNLIYLGSITCLLALSVPAYGACSATHSSCKGKIKRIYLTEGGIIKIQLDPNEANLGVFQCSSYNNYVDLKRDHKNFKENYTFLLSHFMAGKKVSLKLSGTGNTGSSCSVRYVFADAQ